MSEMHDWLAQIQALSPKRLAALCLELRRRADALVEEKHEPIAIIGAGCRYPGGVDGPESFFQLLEAGRCAVRPIEGERLRLLGAGGEGALLAGEHLGHLDDIDRFDASFFGISPREAACMDPQHRILLEVAWSALEHALVPPDSLAGRPVGVFLGITANDYAHLLDHGRPEDIDAYDLTGNPACFAAGRVSYLLGLEGPCVAIDTACSSSLVAVHLACQSLRAKECDLALAAGVNLVLRASGILASRKAGMLSRAGLCKAFDASADGMVRGEGAGVLVLKRRRDALRDGDRIIALIAGSAVNQDGRSSGLTVPSQAAQQAVIREALAAARVRPAEVSYVEAHGTGTPLGDPIEAHALGAALGEGRPADQPFLLGSVKTNLGHLESAAGVAGLIKTALMLERRTVVPHLHLTERSHQIDWSRVPAEIPLRVRPWSPAGGARIAGVSSFGGSGTNAHAIVREAPPAEVRPPSAEHVERPLHLLPLSARSPEARRSLAAKYAAFLADPAAPPIGDVCFSAAVGRAHLTDRLAVRGATADEIRRRLEELVEGRGAAAVSLGRRPRGEPPRVAFLFTGQGALHAGAGRRLFEVEPTFRAALERCARALEPHLDRPLLDLLHPRPGEPDRLQETRYAQPAQLALALSLVELWRSWGIEPHALLGHSLGEYAAACVAGVFAFEDALALAAERGRAMHDLAPRGAMLAVSASPERLAPILEPWGGGIATAAINAAEDTTLSGAEEIITDVARALEREGIRSRRLPVTRAFHAPGMEPAAAALGRRLGAMKLDSPRLPLISNLTGRRAGAEIATPAYWTEHALRPVLFAAGLEALEAMGCDAYLEIGPSPALLPLVRRRSAERRCLPSLREGRDDADTMLHALGELYALGVDVRWPAFHEGRGGRRVRLPSYPFQPRSHWTERAPRAPDPPASPAPRAAEQGGFYTVAWQPAPLPERRGARFAGHWLVLTDARGVGDALAARISAGGGRATQIPASRRDELPARIEQLARDPAGPLSGVVHLWSLDATADPDTTIDILTDGTRLTCGSLLPLAGALAASGGQAPPGLWLVTQGAQPIEGSPRALSPAQAPARGIGRVIALEQPQVWRAAVDLDPRTGAAEAAEQLARELLGGDDEDEIAWQGDTRLVARLAPASPRPASPLRMREDATYLITGGFGGLGLEVAGLLAERGARHLVLTGRNVPAEDHPARRQIQALEARGVTVRAAPADAADPERMAALFEEISRTMPPLRGIVHAAGVTDPALLHETSLERMLAVMRPKVQGGWVLHRLSAHLSLDFFVLFSSASAIWGSVAMGPYAGANHFLDVLAHHRRTSGLPATSVDWGPWSGAGMATEEAVAWLGRMGVASMTPARALDALAALLEQDVTQAVIADVDWARFTPVHAARRRRPLLDRVAGKPGALSTPPAASASWRARVEEASPEARRAVIEGYLRQRIAVALRVPEGDIHEDESILALGMDSLTVMEVVNDCRRDLQITLYAREFFDHPSVRALAGYITADLSRTLAAPASPRPAAARPARPAGSSPPAVFLLSSPRSGSTLLRVMLAGSPALFCPPELHLLPFTRMKERAEALAAGRAGEGLDRALMALHGCSSEEARAMADRFVADDATVEHVYAALQAKAGARLLVDKTPLYASDLAILERAEAFFDRPRYIQLVRHPYAVIESFVRTRMDRAMGAKGQDAMGLAEQTWAAYNANIVDFVRGVGEDRACLVRFEDLMIDPERVMRRLADFLGIPFGPELLTPYEGERMTDGVHATSAPMGDPNFRDHEKIEPEKGDIWRTIRLPRKLSGFARRVAAELGYALPVEDATPAREPTSSGLRGDARPSHGRSSPRVFESREVRRAVPYTLFAPTTKSAEPIPLVLALTGADAGLVGELLAIPERLMAAGHVKPMAVVVPSCERSLYLNRRDGTANWESFLLEELLPSLIDEADLHLDAARIGLLGVSMGGLGALRLAFRRPELFTAVSAHGPAIEPAFTYAEVPREGPLADLRPPSFVEDLYGSPVDADGYWTHNNPAFLARRHRRRIQQRRLGISMVCGALDQLALPGVLFLRDVLRADGVDHECRIVEGLGHDRSLFGVSISQGFTFLSESFAPRAQ